MKCFCCGSVSQSAGVFWLNAAETWIDVASNSDENVVSSIVNFVSGSAKEPQVRNMDHTLLEFNNTKNSVIF